MIHRHRGSLGGSHGGSLGLRSVGRRSLARLGIGGCGVLLHLRVGYTSNLFQCSKPAPV